MKIRTIVIMLTLLVAGLVIGCSSENAENPPTKNEYAPNLESTIEALEGLIDKKLDERISPTMQLLPTTSGRTTPTERKQINQSTPTPEPDGKHITHNEPSIITPSKNFVLSLPFADSDRPSEIMPMGETINHSPPEGHPGIDFQWKYDAEIIVAAEGIVGDIRQEISRFDGATIYTVVIVSGEYGVTYEVEDLYTRNPELTLGDLVELGKVLGYPQSVAKDDDGKMIHWGFGRVRESDGKPNPEGVIERYYFDWLCPMEYLSQSERERLISIWDEAWYQHKDKFPQICNGYYIN